MIVGNPIFRFRLTHAIAGTVEISEPDGWVGAKIQLERDPNFCSLVEKFMGGFMFYGNNGIDNGGIDFIRYVERIYGIDAELIVTIDVSFDSGVTYESIFTGLYDFSLNEETNQNKIKSAIIRESKWAKFISRLDTPVDIRSPKDLDGNPVDILDGQPLRLTSQIIPTQFDAQAIDYGIELADGSTPWFEGNYYQLSWDTINLDEFETRYTLPQAGNPDLPVDTFVNFYEGEHRFQFSTWAYLPTYSFVFPDNISNYMAAYLNINGTEIPFTLDANPLPGYDRLATWSINHTQTLPANSSIKVYIKILAPIATIYAGEFWWNGEFPTTIIDPIVLHSTASIVAQTIYPETYAPAFFTHDVLASAVKRTSGFNFYSEYLGNQLTLARTYDSVGCGSNYMNAKGLHLRRYTLEEKPFFQSVNDEWNGINPILNLGLSYEEVEGIELIRVEEKSRYYDTEISVRFDYVFDIIRRYDQDMIFNRVRNGYKKWESESVSGIDDPQTKQTRTNRLTKVGKEIILESDFIGASQAIEETRRQTIKKTKDYKLDNDTFIIAVRENDASPGQLVPQLDEDFESITNLTNSQNRYNLKITPARNFLRWVNYLNGCLQAYIGSVYKFVSGEGNFDMESDLIDTTPDCNEYQTNLSEKQDIVVTDDYLHLPELFEIKLSMSWDDYVTIRDNRTKAIGISQTNANHTAFFIKDLQYELCASKAVIQAWPKTPFYITNTDFVQPSRVCVESVEVECDDALLTEIQDELETELEECLISE